MAINVEKIRLNKIRGSYVHLFVAHAMNEGDTPKFSVNCILNKKKHKAEIKTIEAAIAAVIQEKWKGKKPAGLKVCLRDGSEFDDKDGYGDDVMFIAASTDKRPPVIDKDGSMLTAEDDTIYSGCYLDVTIRLWAQDNKWGKRVNCALRAVKFNCDGEPLGREKIDVESEFDDDDADDDDDDDDDEEEETPAQKKRRLAKAAEAKAKKKKGGSVL